MIKIDDNVRINGGKSNKCEGIVTDLKNVFCLVRITKDKKGVSVFGDKSIKVKKTYLEVIEPPPIEMPTQSDCIAVDNPDIFKTIDDAISNPFLAQSQDKKVTIKEVVEEITSESEEEVKPYVPPSVLINENNVSSPAPTIDDALNWKRDNEKLNLQLQSMISFQSNACAEIAELKMVIKELREQVGDSCRLEKIEELKNLINSL